MSGHNLTRSTTARRRMPLFVAFAIALVCLLGFWELAEDFAYSPAVVAFDARVTTAIQSVRSPTLTAFVVFTTTTGGTLVVSALTLAGFVMLWRRRHDFAVYFIVAVAGGAILTAVLKNRFGRLRPSAEFALVGLPESFAFPSGHSMASLCVAVAGSYLALRSNLGSAAKAWTVAGLTAWALLVGGSRVYLGVHWPSDVLASWLLGAAWLAPVIGLAEYRRRRAER